MRPGTRSSATALRRSSLVARACAAQLASIQRGGNPRARTDLETRVAVRFRVTERCIDGTGKVGGSFRSLPKDDRFATGSPLVRSWGALTLVERGFERRTKVDEHGGRC